MILPSRLLLSTWMHSWYNDCMVVGPFLRPEYTASERDDAFMSLNSNTGGGGAEIIKIGHVYYTGQDR